MATNQQFKRPAATLRGGNIKATIWRNVSEKGLAWRNGTSFGLNDLEAFMNVVFEVKEWINA